jgi:hypothetical protein
MINVCRILIGKHERKRPPGRYRRRWRLMLKCMLKKYDMRVLTEFAWPRIGTSGRLLYVR